MNILEFIETQYPIKDKVREKLEDPYKRIAEMDELPYDSIGPDETGRITKLVEIDDTRSVPVLELISYTEDDVKKMEDSAYYDAWKAYMSNIDINDINIVDIMSCVQRYRESSIRREEQLGVLSL